MLPKNFVAFSKDNAERSNYDVTSEKLIRGESRQSALNMFSDPGNEFHCGIWEGGPALWRVLRFAWFLVYRLMKLGFPNPD